MATNCTIGGQAVELRFDRRARYRIGSLNGPVEFGQMHDDNKAFAVLCNWVWACSTTFKTPEDIASNITEEQIPDAMSAVAEAIQEATRPDEAEKKS